MTAAINTIKRLDALRSKLESVDDDATNSDMTPVIDQATSDFCHAMDDDLNTPRAAAAMFLVVNAAEKRLKAGTLGFQDAEDVLDCLDDMDRVFGIFYTPVLDNGATSIEESVSEHQGVPEELVDLLSERAEARKAKNYGRADEIRQTITAAGFSILDTPQGAKLQRIES